MSFHTYMLRCADGSYYVGHTDDLEARIGAQDERFLNDPDPLILSCGPSEAKGRVSKGERDA